MSFSTIYFISIGIFILSIFGRILLRRREEDRIKRNRQKILQDLLVRGKNLLESILDTIPNTNGLEKILLQEKNFPEERKTKALALAQEATICNQLRRKLSAEIQEAIKKYKPQEADPLTTKIAQLKITTLEVKSLMSSNEEFIQKTQNFFKDYAEFLKIPEEEKRKSQELLKQTLQLPQTHLERIAESLTHLEELTRE